jgi:hypothetical protein
VKDGSGALYCFALQGKTIKAGTYSLTQRGTPKIKQNAIEFKLCCAIEIDQQGSGVKSLDGLQKFYNFAIRNYNVN